MSDSELDAVPGHPRVSLEMIHFEISALTKVVSSLAKDVKALRDATGAGMMDAKKALTEADGDFEAAGNYLVSLAFHHVGGRADVNHHVVVYTGAEIVAVVLRGMRRSRDADTHQPRRSLELITPKASDSSNDAGFARQAGLFRLPLWSTQVN